MYNRKEQKKNLFFGRGDFPFAWRNLSTLRLVPALGCRDKALTVLALPRQDQFDWKKYQNDETITRCVLFM